MKIKRYSDVHILGVLKWAESGVPILELCHELYPVTAFETDRQFCLARVFGSPGSLKGYEMRTKTGPNGLADKHVKEIAAF